jgi:hypothetical protein
MHFLLKIKPYLRPLSRACFATAFVLSLGACSTLQNIGAAISAGTASIANPVTPTRLNQMESTLTLVFAGLNTWRTSCAQGLIPVNCKVQIAAVQVYTRQIPPYLAQLRAFVKSGDQINAVSIFNQLTALVGTIKDHAAASGQTVGG